MQRCPVCQAENVAPPICRRCKADLELVARAEAMLQVKAVTALLERDFPEALRSYHDLKG